MGKESVWNRQPSGRESYPPKVKAMYEAVLDLFASGR